MKEVNEAITAMREEQGRSEQSLREVRDRVYTDHAGVKTARDALDAARQAVREAEEQEPLVALRQTRDEAARAHSARLRETIDGDSKVTKLRAESSAMQERMDALEARIKAIRLSEGIKLAKVKERKLEDGLTFRAYEWSSDAGAAPKYDALDPAKTGIVETPTLEVRTRDDWYAVVYTGYLKIDEKGPHTFYLESDDGSDLYISGTPVIENLGMHGMQEVSQEVILEKGHYEVRITFYQGSGGHGLNLKWKAPGMEAKQPIPASVFKTMPD
jgi:hypothetical protein